MLSLAATTILAAAAEYLVDSIVATAGIEDQAWPAAGNPLIIIELVNADEVVVEGRGAIRAESIS